MSDTNFPRDDTGVSSFEVPGVVAPKKQSISPRTLGIIVLVVLMLGGLTYAGFKKTFGSTKEEKQEAADKKAVAPAAVKIQAKKFDDKPPLLATSASAPARAASVPALPPVPAVATGDEADPIGLKNGGTGQGSKTSSGSGSGRSGSQAPVAPQDGPILVTEATGSSLRSGGASTASGQGSGHESGGGAAENATSDASRRLAEYKQTLTNTLETLTRQHNLTGKAGVQLPNVGSGSLQGASGGNDASGQGLFGGQVQGSATPRVQATNVGDKSLLMAKGTAFTCALKGKIISAVSGFFGCQATRDVYGFDGRVKLVEKGSHFDGEYRVTTVRPGVTRIPGIFTRMLTPNGVSVDLESPATGPLGESGVGGYVDNRWVERVGGAMLVAFLDDAIAAMLKPDENNSTSVQLNSTSSTAKSMPERVLESTINVPPLIYSNQGSVVGVYVARDVDFSRVYELRPVQR